MTIEQKKLHDQLQQDLQKIKVLSIFAIITSLATIAWLVFSFTSKLN